MARSLSYGEDLAFIHDVGFGHIAEPAADLVLAELKGKKFDSKRVIDLGCGSGILAAKLTRAGYDVIGYDQSSAMIELARQHCPAGVFHRASFLDVKLPEAVAITAVGEILSYLMDARNSWNQVRALFRRIHDALVPGGLFLFDIVTPGRAPPPGKQGFKEGNGWACLYSQIEEPKTKTLVRTITTFRQEGKLFRRREEVHRLKLLDIEKIRAELKSIGFRVEIMEGYGDFAFPPGLVGFLARKR